MHGIHEHDHVVRAFVFLQVFVLGEKGALGLRVGLAGNELGLLVDEPEAMQQGRHAAGSIGDPEFGLDPRCDVLGREVQVFLKMQIEPIELRSRSTAHRCRDTRL